MSAVELVEAEDRWVVPLDGCTVTQCRVDYAFTLLIGGPRGVFEVRIEQPFELLRKSTAGRPLRLSLEGEPSALAPALDVLHSELKEALAFKDGRLELVLSAGGWMRVPAAEEFEAWSLVGPDGLRLVSLPGAGLAIWSSDDAGAASA